jgi:hypothetical protein
MASHFTAMSKTELVHPEGTLEVPARLLVGKCDLFCNDLSLLSSPYHLKSVVSFADFRDFVSALGGFAVQINNSNFRALSCLCDEFGCGDLSGRLSAFRESPDFKEEAMPAEESELLRRLQVQGLAIEGLVHRLAQLEAQVLAPKGSGWFGRSSSSTQPWASQQVPDVSGCDACLVFFVVMVAVTMIWFVLRK